MQERQTTGDCVTEIERVRKFIGITVTFSQNCPDLDVYSRISNFLPQFEEKTAIVLQPTQLSGFGQKSALWKRETFPALFLPISLTNSVGDIWRSYIAETVAGRFDISVAFVAPAVYGGCKDATKEGAADEWRLFYETDLLIQILRKSEPLKSPNSSIVENLYDIYDKLFKSELLYSSDMKAISIWTEHFDDIFLAK